MQPAKLALVPEAQEEEKIKAQHSIGSTPADSSLEEHAAKKLKSADGSTNMETPLLKEQVTQLHDAKVTETRNSICDN